jgi:site-specific DNA-methyltransferase (adenine-specific)/modification methylase
VTGNRVVKFGESVTLYEGDCWEILPNLSIAIAGTVTDPPYGTGWVKGGGKRARVFSASHEKPEWDVFSIDWIENVLRFGYVAAFCAPSFLDKLVPAFATPYVGRYRKTNVRPGGNKFEFIVANLPWRSSPWEVVAYNGDNDHHPTEKPIDVMLWCVENAPVDGTILDPFMGSGTTGVAAIKLKKGFVGIEADPEYFDTACRRIEDAMKTIRLF